MIRIRTGKVIEISENFAEIQMIKVEMEGREGKAINYPHLTGKVSKGDLVQLNTTAVNLRLGTGGYHFVTAIIKEGIVDPEGIDGHIMKMRYAPQQVKVLSVEEEASPFHQQIKNFSSLNNTPVIIGFLHSMLLPAVAGIKAINKDLRICYIMTDGGALPLAFSKTARQLKKLGWLEGTVTVGHAFGGDLEAVNIYSGLAAAYSVQKADVIIVIMGPGNVGTGTELGTSALEVGQIINAVHTLKGRPIVMPRISFKDQRKRHYGISHHVITALVKVALVPSTLILPQLEDENKLKILNSQLKKYFNSDKFRIYFEDGKPGLEFLKCTGLEVMTMGRTIMDEPEFFLLCCAAGSYTAKLM